jgi:cytochrome c-type biogenesis protein CcmF
VEILFVDYDFDETDRSNMMAGGEFAIGAKLEVKHYGEVYKVTPKFVSKEGERKDMPADIKDANISISFASLSADQGKATIVVSPYTLEKFPTPAKQEILAVNASVKPFINLVWAGTVILSIGFLISIIRRSKESKA